MNKKAKGAIAIFAVVVVLGALLGSVCVTTIPAGHAGIISIFGNVQDNVLDSGLHFKNPFANIIKMDYREQKTVFETQSFSSDIQQVDIVGSINYNINKNTAMTLYKGVGTDYYNVVLVPRLLENIKAVFSKHSAEKLVSNRETLSVQIRELLQVEMERHGINIINVSIENIDFTDAFTNAVEEKQVAEQTKLRVETEEAQKTSVERATAERLIISTEAEANQKKIQADADANVKKVQADAEAYAISVRAQAEAEANAKISLSLTQDLIEYQKINAWDGKNPTTVIGGDSGAVPVITVP